MACDTASLGLWVYGFIALWMLTYGPVTLLDGLVFASFVALLFYRRPDLRNRLLAWVRQRILMPVTTWLKHTLAAA